MRWAPQADTMGGEDFAEFLRTPRVRPGFFVRIGTGVGHPNHHPGFVADPAALLPASLFLAEMAVTLMTEGIPGKSGDDSRT